MNVRPTEISRSEFFNIRSRSLRAVVCSPGCTVGLPGELEKKNYPTSKILIFWSGVKDPELLFFFLISSDNSNVNLDEEPPY